MKAKKRRAEEPGGRGEVRYDAFLTAATEVFLEFGFANATLDEVIRRSGGSRATLYAQFGSKEGLFAAIIAAKRDQIVAALEQMATGGAVDEVLKRFATAYMRELMAPEGLALYRVVIGESARFPDLGASVFSSGPQTAASRLASYLRDQSESGVLDLPDPDLAARQFLQIVKGDLHERALMQPALIVTKKAIAHCIAVAIATFLNGARRRRPPGE